MSNKKRKRSTQHIEREEVAKKFSELVRRLTDPGPKKVVSKQRLADELNITVATLNGVLRGSSTQVTEEMLEVIIHKWGREIGYEIEEEIEIKKKELNKLEEILRNQAQMSVLIKGIEVDMTRLMEQKISEAIEKAVPEIVYRIKKDLQGE